jgi:apolipoprotein N-acyltransferase
LAVVRGRLVPRLRGRAAGSSPIGAEGAGAHRWAWRLVAGVLGVPLALAFPRPAQWWLGFIALAPLILLARGAPSAREAGIRTWLGGSVFFLSVDSWLLPEANVLAIPAALLLGVLWLPWGRLAWRLLGSRAAPWQVPARLAAGRVALAMLLLPSAFVLGEVVRSWDALGGPWALLGASQWNDLPILALASLGGVWLVSLVLMAVNVGVAVTVGPRVPITVRAGAALATCALLLGSLAWSAVRPTPVSDGRTLRVGLVQPGKIDPVEPRLAASESASLGLAPSHPDLIVWSESSVGRDPATNPGDVVALRRVVQATGADVLANVDARRRSGGIYKSSLLVGPNGPVASYDKIRLVPFGEYIPARPLLGWVARFTQAAARNRHHGSRLVLMRSGSVQFGPLICFESAFPDMSRNLARMGADLIVVQSATTTFQSTWGPEQHGSLAAVRAVESGRPVVQASIAGPSVAFDPRGRQLAWQPTTFRGAVVVPVPLSHDDTVFDRFGNWVPLGCAAALVLAGLLSLRRRRDLPPDQPTRRSLVLVALYHPTSVWDRGHRRGDLGFRFL